MRENQLVARLFQESDFLLQNKMTQGGVFYKHFSFQFWRGLTTRVPLILLHKLSILVIYIYLIDVFLLRNEKPSYKIWLTAFGLKNCILLFSIFKCK